METYWQTMGTKELASRWMLFAPGNVHRDEIVRVVKARGELAVFDLALDGPLEEED